MGLLGEHYILDFCKRSDEEQYRLWQIGRDENGNKIGDTVTECDGIKIVSAHQRGMALDILFIENKVISNPNIGWDYWRKKWQGYGGKPVVIFKDGRKDNCHFEG